MKVTKEIMPEYPDYFEPQYPGRPLESIQDLDGNYWLCDKGIDKDGDLEAQGCWRCEDVAFPYAGR